MNKALHDTRQELEEKDRLLLDALKRCEENSAEAEKARLARSEFLSRMSYEIRTPLHAVVGMSALLLETSLSSEQRQYVHVLRSAGETLLNIVNDMLDISEIEAGRRKLDRVAFDLREILEKTCGLMATRAGHKGIALTWHMDRDVPERLYGDPGPLGQILTNLVGNAVKFTEHGRVVVRVRKEGEEDGGGKDREAAGAILVFSVFDTGIGIPRDRASEIFEGPSQGDGSPIRKYGGAGLGLQICKRLVDLMGGTIRAESQPGLGSTFTFTLPFDRPEEHGAENEKPTPEEETRHPLLGAVPLFLAGPGVEDEPKMVAESSEQAEPAPLRILLVEDSQTNRLLVQAFLKKLPWQIEVAENGQIAVEKFRSRSYDLVLMDIEMPVMDGYTATRTIREWEKEQGRERTPILALTAYALQGAEQESLQAGCDGHLTKPIRKEELIENMRRYIQGPKETAASPRRPDRILVRVDKDIEELVPGFLQTQREDLEAMSRAVEGSDFRTVQLLGHRMKGAGGGYGFDKITEIGVALEKAAKDQDVQVIRDGLSTLASYLDSVEVVYE